MSTTNTPRGAGAGTGAGTDPAAEAAVITPGANGPRRSVRASGPLFAWRTVDLITCAMIGVAFGVVFWAWGLIYAVPSDALSAIFPPLAGLFGAPWLMAGVVGGLVIRRPGAALFAEIVAASVEALIGTHWGVSTLVSGIVQGLGAELVFAALAYATWRVWVAMAAGALAGAFESVYEWFSYWQDWGMDYKLAHLVILAASGAIVAGGLSWALVRALASAGTLRALPPGAELAERTAAR